MGKKLTLHLHGFLIVLTGILLINLPHVSLNSLKYILMGGLIPSAIFAIITTIKREKKQVDFAYQEIHALAIVVFVIAILFFCNSMDMLNYCFAFLFFFYAFSEIIFCNWLFNLEEKVNFKILFIRFILGLFTGIGTLFILSYSEFDQISKMIGFGILFIIVGTNILLYHPIINNERSK